MKASYTYKDSVTVIASDSKEADEKHQKICKYCKVPVLYKLLQM